MLAARYKSPWRLVPGSGTHTVGALVAAAGGSPVTVGFALGSGTMPTGAVIGGVVAACNPWGACAVAATRIVLAGSRVMASLAKGAVNGLPAAAPGADVVPVSRTNAMQAIPALDTSSILLYGNTAPWLPVGEALARAGVWMRRRSEPDVIKRIRFESGAGTTLAVCVVINAATPAAVALRTSDFGASDFLADDWEAWAVGEPPAIDVTDFLVGSMSGNTDEGFFFAVDSPPGDGGGGGDPSPTPISDGDYVKMSRGGVEQWVPVSPFACPIL